MKRVSHHYQETADVSNSCTSVEVDGDFPLKLLIFFLPAIIILLPQRLYRFHCARPSSVSHDFMSHLIQPQLHCMAQRPSIII